MKEVLYRFIRAHYAEVLAVWPMTLLLIGLFIAVGIVSYNGHLAHGYTWKLRKKVMGGYILTHAQKNENEGDDIWY